MTIGQFLLSVAIVGVLLRIARFLAERGDGMQHHADPVDWMWWE